MGAMSKVTLAMERPFDLVDLDHRTPFVEFLLGRGKLCSIYGFELQWGNMAHRWSEAVAALSSGSEPD